MIKKLLLPAIVLSLITAPAFADNPIEGGMKDSVYNECHFRLKGEVVKEFGQLLMREHNYCAKQKGKCNYTKAQKCQDWRDIDEGKVQPNHEPSITEKATQSVRDKTAELSHTIGM